MRQDIQIGYTKEGHKSKGKQTVILTYTNIGNLKVKVIRFVSIIIITKKTA